jgi:hypothetical protein
MMPLFWDKSLEQETIADLEAVLAEVGGGLAPFDPYLHWSLSRRSHFVSTSQVEVVREYVAGLHVVLSDGVFYVARRFMNTNGWFWSCVPLKDAQSDDRMLHTMMDGAA